MRAATRSICLLVSLSAGLAPLASAPARAAASPEAIATHDFLAGQNAARSAFRSALEDADAELATGIGAAEQAFAASGDANATGDTLFAALRVFQGEVFLALQTASVDRATAAKNALAGLGAGLGGVFPASFYPSDGAATGGFEQSIAKDMDKEYGKLRKRLARTAKRFEAAGFSLTLRLAPPLGLSSVVWSEDSLGFLAGFAPGIDLVLAWSDLAAASDGELRIEGSTSAVAVNVTILNHSTLSTFSVPALVAAQRFRASFSGAPEGVCRVSTDGTQPASLTVGVR